jgi:hypothetical protein
MKTPEFADFLSREARSLLVEHIDAIEQAAAECTDPADDKPVKAKVSIAFQWEAGSATPKVVTRLSYSVAHKDETERTYDPDQIYMQMEEGVRQDFSARGTVSSEDDD